MIEDRAGEEVEAAEDETRQNQREYGEAQDSTRAARPGRLVVAAILGARDPLGGHAGGVGRALVVVVPTRVHEGESGGRRPPFRATWTVVGRVLSV